MLSVPDGAEIVSVTDAGLHRWFGMGTDGESIAHSDMATKNAF
jgi:hypothetical protein